MKWTERITIIDHGRETVIVTNERKIDKQKSSNERNSLARADTYEYGHKWCPEAGQPYKNAERNDSLRTNGRPVTIGNSDLPAAAGRVTQSLPVNVLLVWQKLFPGAFRGSFRVSYSLF